MWRYLALSVAASDARWRLEDHGRYRSQRGPLDPMVLPRRAAAVHIFDGQGLARTISFDLDAKVHRPVDVETDCDRLIEELGEFGLSVMVDESPTGGRHVYLPLAEPLPQSVVLSLAGALSQRLMLRTLDLAPLRNARTGAIRPPGSAHPGGGHQQLITPQTLAVETMWARNDPAAVRHLLRCLGVEAVPRPEAVPVGQPQKSRRRKDALPKAPLDAGRLQILRMGQHPGYATR